MDLDSVRKGGNGNCLHGPRCERNRNAEAETTQEEQKEAPTHTSGHVWMNVLGIHEDDPLMQQFLAKPRDASELVQPLLQSLNLTCRSVCPRWLLAHGLITRYAHPTSALKVDFGFSGLGLPCIPMKGGSRSSS